jgi:hypothetical protein
MQSHTPYLRTRPVHIAFCMVCILTAYILLHNIPAIPDRPMVTAWRPEMFITKLLEMRKFFPQYPACPSFQSLGDEAERILRRIFEKYVDMVWINCDSNYLNIQFFACLAEDALCYHCYITGQYLAPVFRGEHHMIREQRHGMPVVAEILTIFKFFHDFTK